MTTQGIVFAGIQMPRTEEPHLSQQLGSRALAQHAKGLLKQVPMGKSEKKSYNHNKHMYCLITDADSVKFLVVTPEDYPRLTSFECLEHMKRAFATYKSDLARLDEEIGRIVAKYSDPNANKVMALKSQVAETRQVMVDNIDRVLERGEKIEDVCAETEQLTREAKRFEDQSRKLKYAMWKKKLVWIFAGVVAFLIIAFVIILLLCRESGKGAVNWDKCKAK
jgi:vesicle-associated membrane protein 7